MCELLGNSDASTLGMLLAFFKILMVKFSEQTIPLIFLLIPMQTMVLLHLLLTKAQATLSHLLIGQCHMRLFNAYIF